MPCWKGKPANSRSHNATISIGLRNAKRLARVADEIAFVAKEDDDTSASPV